MPGIREIEIYLTGLWLLIRGKGLGFSYLDLSDRGFNRSFWAVAWSLPGLAFTWVFRYVALVQDLPEGASVDAGTFLLRVALVDAAGWILPLLLLALVAAPLGIANRFNALVVTTNWFSVPVAYANALLIAIWVLVPGLGQLIVLLWLIMLMALVVGLFRLFFAIAGPSILLVATLTLMMLVPTTLLSDFLERFLDLSMM